MPLLTMRKNQPERPHPEEVRSAVSQEWDATSVTSIMD
jgi:hypothetical protein